MNITVFKALSVVYMGAFILPQAVAESYWAAGVTESGGWVDVNKAYAENAPVFDDPSKIPAVFPNNDSSMCWAASTANILQYMMNQKGYATEYSTTWYAAQSSGKSASYIANVQSRNQYAIFETLTNNFSNQGWYQFDAMAWYTTGATAYTEYNATDRPLKSGAGMGGFYQSSVGSTTDDFQNKILVSHYHFNGFANGGTAVTVSSTGLSYMKAVTAYDPTFGEYNTVEKVTTSYTELFKDALDVDSGDRKPIALNVNFRNADGSWNTSSAHAMTCWGFETDADGNISKLYVTDSDDAIERLMSLDVTIDENGYMQLGTDVDIVNVYDEEGNVVDTTFVGGIYNEYLVTDISSYNNFFASVPEPATASLSLLGLAALMMRRRRG